MIRKGNNLSKILIVLLLIFSLGAPAVFAERHRRPRHTKLKRIGIGAAIGAGAGGLIGGRKGALIGAGAGAGGGYIYHRHKQRRRYRNR